jgi:MerR family transcriptional regulator, thiopeptide resistance regulator
MKMLTVKQVARLSGVSVRALHHYDEIGLLKPARTGPNRYRYYGQEELLRLQQILIHRELDIPLSEIAAILDAPGFDRLKTLRQQRERLEAEAKRYAQLVKTIDRTIASLKGDRVMKNAELYKGISSATQAEYEDWLVQKYGGDMPERIAVSKKKYADLSEADKERLGTELKEVEAAWVEAMEKGIAADARALDPLLGRYRDWVAFMWDKPCPPEAFAGLADLHLSHPDFVSRYETLAPGFSEYHAAAMKAYAKRLAPGISTATPNAIIQRDHRI